MLVLFSFYSFQLLSRYYSASDWKKEGQCTGRKLYLTMRPLIASIMSWHVKMLVALIVVTLCSGSSGHSMNITVAKDGSGHFSTISEAITAAPKLSATKFYIGIGAGTYKEYVFIGANKENIVLIGEGMDKTIITGDRSNVTGFGTYNSSTVVIEGQGFTAVNMTIENTAGPSMGQAVAATIKAASSAFYRCRFTGFQDTLFTVRYKQFFRECEIYGTVDFIFGDSTAVFQNCMIYVREPHDSQKNTITAQKREIAAGTSGFIIQNCTIEAASDLRPQLSKFKTFLGRPWGSFSRTVIINTFLGDLIDPAGWLEWEGKDSAQLHNVFYAEYKNKGPGAGTKGRVPWARQINSSTKAAEFTVRNFINGDKWIPSIVPFFPDLM